MVFGVVCFCVDIEYTIIKSCRTLLLETRTCEKDLEFGNRKNFPSFFQAFFIVVCKITIPYDRGLMDRKISRAFKVMFGHKNAFFVS